MGGIDKMTLLFGNQLFGLIQRSKSTDKKPKPTLTFLRLLESPERRKQK
jgi:hypothetical protein